MKLFEKIKVNQEREIRILNIPVLQYGRIENDLSPFAIS
jgi:hypothetical protein